MLLVIMVETFLKLSHGPSVDEWRGPSRDDLLGTRSSQRLADGGPADSLTFLKRRVCNGGLPHPYPTDNSPDPPLRLKPNEKEETIMDRMLVVVFDNESKAYEGSRSLQQLYEHGSIAVYAARVGSNNPDGT